MLPETPPEGAELALEEDVPVVDVEVVEVVAAGAGLVAAAWVGTLRDGTPAVLPEVPPPPLPQAASIPQAHASARTRRATVKNPAVPSACRSADSRSDPSG